MSSQYYSATAYVGTPHRNEVEVTIPLVGPAGPQGPAGEGGGGDVESVNGQTGVVVLAPADIGAVASNDARLTDARTPLSHTHGNITNAGLVGTTSGLPLKTGTGGIVEAGAFGTTAGQFAEGNHTHSVAAITDLKSAGYAAGLWDNGPEEPYGNKLGLVIEDGELRMNDLAFLRTTNLTSPRVFEYPNASGTLVISSTTGITGADAVTNIVSLTQAEYNAIGSPDAATLFLITDP
jgi:hypothetical protein